MVTIRKVILGCVITRLVYDACWYVFTHNDYHLDEHVSEMKLEKENCETFFTEMEQEFNPINFNGTEQTCWCNYHEGGPGLVPTNIEFGELLNVLDKNFEKKSLFTRVFEDMFYTLEFHKYIDGAIVLCVMLGLNREWLHNLVHVGLVILSLIYDPVVAIGVYGYVVLTPDEDSHVA